jgi:hypothetical protein
MGILQMRVDFGIKMTKCFINSDLAQSKNFISLSPAIICAFHPFAKELLEGGL